MLTWSKVSDSVLHIANDLIYDFHAELAAARVGFVFRSEAGKSCGMKVLAKASKVSPKMQVHMKLDFLIWIAEDIWGDLSIEQRKALIDHELYHCSYIGGAAKMRAHDIEEFEPILKRYGLWHINLFRLKDTLESACQLKLSIPGETGGAVVAVEPGTMGSYRESDEGEGEDPEEQPEPVAIVGEHMIFAGESIGNQVFETLAGATNATVSRNGNGGGHLQIDIDMDKPCSACGQPGATQNGLCLSCIGEKIAEGGDGKETK